MRKLHIAALSVATLSLMAGCNNEVGRYQLVVNPPVNGPNKWWQATEYVLDTKTGRMWKTSGSQDYTSTWDPTKGTWSIDSLAITDNRKNN